MTAAYILGCTVVQLHGKVWDLDRYASACYPQPWAGSLHIWAQGMRPKPPGLRTSCSCPPLQGGKRSSSHLTNRNGGRKKQTTRLLAKNPSVWLALSPGHCQAWVLARARKSQRRRLQGPSQTGPHFTSPLEAPLAAAPAPPTREGGHGLACQ